MKGNNRTCHGLSPIPIEFLLECSKGRPLHTLSATRIRYFTSINSFITTSSWTFQACIPPHVCCVEQPFRFFVYRKVQVIEAQIQTHKLHTPYTHAQLTCNDNISQASTMMNIFYLHLYQTCGRLCSYLITDCVGLKCSVESILPKETLMFGHFVTFVTESPSIYFVYMDSSFKTNKFARIMHT